MADDLPTKNEHHDRVFKGIWIPAEIWDHPQLTQTQKILWAELHSLDGPRGCFASNKYLSSMLGVSEDRITRHISALKKHGLVEQTGFNGRRRSLITKIPDNHKPRRKHRGRPGENTEAKKREKSKEVIENKEKNDNIRKPLLYNKEYGNTSYYRRSDGTAEKLIDFWNGLPNTPKTNREYKRNGIMLKSKSYTRAKQMLHELMEGTLFEKNKLSKRQQAQLSSKGIPRKFTPEQIKNTFRKMDDLFIQGRFPVDKSSLPKTLSSLLYNPGSGFSWFLTRFCHMTHIRDEYPEATKYFLDHALLKRYPDEQEKKILIRNLNGVMAWQSHIINGWGNDERIGDIIHFNIGTAELMMQSLINWHKETFEDYMEPVATGPMNRKAWNMFINWLNETVFQGDYDFRSLPK